MSAILCIAHRGGPVIGDHISPENSLEAIGRSLDLGVDAIEIDIFQVAGELFVTHDRRLGRQIKGEGLLTNKTPEELTQLRLANGEILPRLHQVLELIADRALLNIEIKGAQCVSALVQTLRSFCRDRQISADQYIISSFDHQQLFDMLQRAPEFRRGVLIEGIPLDYARCCEPLKAYAFNTHLGFLTQELIADSRQRGLQNWVYTVNHPDDWQWLVDLKVDGVFTDKPAAFMQFLRSIEAI